MLIEIEIEYGNLFSLGVESGRPPLATSVRSYLFLFPEVVVKVEGLLEVVEDMIHLLA